MPRTARSVIRAGCNPIPLTGRAAKTEEMAVRLFSANPHAGFITGEILNVNGRGRIGRRWREQLLVLAHANKANKTNENTSIVFSVRSRDSQPRRRGPAAFAESQSNPAEGASRFKKSN